MNFLVTKQIIFFRAYKVIASAQLYSCGHSRNKIQLVIGSIEYKKTFLRLWIYLKKNPLGKLI
jgi:predicted lipase